MRRCPDCTYRLAPEAPTGLGPFADEAVWGLGSALRRAIATREVLSRRADFVSRAYARRTSATRAWRAEGTRTMTDRVQQILSWYSSENPGTLTNLARLLNHGALAGTGKLVILPVDQGFEHGPARSLRPQPAAYDPDYHFELAIEAGCNAYAAPLGSLEASAAQVRRRDPDRFSSSTTATRSRSSTSPSPPSPARWRMRCGSAASRLATPSIPAPGARNTMYEELREITLEAKRQGLVVIVWSYPRGSSLFEGRGDGRRRVRLRRDYRGAARRAHHQGQAPTAHIEQEEARKVYESVQDPDRAPSRSGSATSFRRRSTASASSSSRAASREAPEALLHDIRALAQGGAFGSIMGRNAFQRPRAEALALLRR